LYSLISILFYIYRCFIFNDVFGYIDNLHNKIFLLNKLEKIYFFFLSYNSSIFIYIFILLFLFFIAAKKKKIVLKMTLFFSIWFLLTFLPILNKEFDVENIDSIHYFFNSAFPFSVLLAIFINSLLSISLKNKTVCCLIVFFILFMLFVNLKNVYIWNNLIDIKKKFSFQAADVVLNNPYHISVFLLKYYPYYKIDINEDHLLNRYVFNSKKILLDSTDELNYKLYDMDKSGFYVIDDKIKEIDKNSKETIDFFSNTIGYNIVKKFENGLNYELSYSEIFWLYSGTYNPAISLFIKKIAKIIILVILKL
ncbi:MAG TPA: hypothetical protein PLQ81_08845, partial [bacterium]|nr:hypothetical protein [bacterium]